MVKSGAFDIIYENRNRLYSSISIMLLHSQKTLNDIKNNQNSLFDNISDIELSKSFKVINEWNILQKETNEINALGYYLNYHPLKKYMNVLSKLDIVFSSDLNQNFEEIKSKKFIKVVGLVQKIHRRKSQTGISYGVVEVNDNFGDFEITYDENNLSRLIEIYEKSSLFVFNVELKLDNNSNFRLLERRTETIETIFRKNNLCIEFELSNLEAIDEIKKQTSGSIEEGSKVFFKIILGNDIVYIDSKEKVILDKSSLNNFYNINGVNSCKTLLIFKNLIKLLKKI